MNRWRDFLYPFPDDELASLWRVMDAMSAEHSTSLDWEAADICLVSIPDPAAAIYLHMAFGQPRFAALNGEPLFHPDEVVIGIQDRTSCERLVANCPEAKWSALVRMSFESNEVHRAFGAAYTEITGMPNGAPSTV